ncbi:MAG: pyridoxal 5'-phosphate synthase glutaminase subunit PdxT [Myxococcota bacterium]
MARRRQARATGTGGKRRVGVLAIQGDVERHLAAIERLGAEGRRVRLPADLEGLDALILPGGESTTIAKGLDRHGLVEPIRAFAAAGGAVLGTCAGAILLARESRNHPVPTLGLVDVAAIRNAYGTQVDSFVAPVDADARPALRGLACVFIRAPRLAEPGPGVEVWARVDGEPVLVRQGRRLACTFHPELTEDLRVHAALIALAGGGPAD